MQHYWANSVLVVVGEIDMAEVTFIDSSGLNCIARAVHAQRDVTLLAPTRAVRRVLEMTNLAEALTIVD